MMRLILVAIFLTGCSVESHSSNQSITVFAAASLTDILNEFVKRFELENPNVKVHAHIGPTSLLARQIEQGAPADIFMVASPEWIDFLHQRDFIRGSTFRLAGNSLVVMGSPTMDVLTDISELANADRISMADPSHVPSGVYSKQALQCLELWETIQPNVIPTLDSRAALTAVISGAADLVVVYGSDSVLSTEIKVVFEIPESCTPDINYAISILSQTSNPQLAEAFLFFTTDSLNHALWEQFGFSL